MSITNGTVKFGRTIKTGDYENKRADVELSFSMEEGENAEDKIALVGRLAQKHCLDILGEAVSTAVKKTAPKAPKLPITKAAVSDPTEVEEAPSERPPVPATLENAPVPPKAKEPEPAAEEDLGDLLGESEPAKEITDKELNDATQKCQSANKNAPAIRKALATVGVKSPPGRLIDIPQAKRSEYLKLLEEIRPLA